MTEEGFKHIREVVGTLKTEKITGLPKSIGKEDRVVDVFQSMRVNPHHTFESFKVLKGTEDAYNAFKTLAEDEGAKPLLLCYGGVGNGKTHLCEALVMALNDRRITCRYYTVSELMSVLKQRMNDNQLPGSDDIVELWSKAPAMIMDDLGLEYGTPWEESKLELIFDKRYRADLITVVTTNKDLDELPPRIVSRFLDGSVSVCVLNSGEDYRRLNHDRTG